MVPLARRLRSRAVCTRSELHQPLLESGWAPQPSWAVSVTALSRKGGNPARGRAPAPGGGCGECSRRRPRDPSDDGKAWTPVINVMSFETAEPTWTSKVKGKVSE